MKKFIRILSPITIAVIFALDAAVIAFLVYSIKRIIAEQTLITIAFIIIEILALLIAFFTTKEIFSNGVLFDDDKVEFTGLDTDNEFKYCDIIKCETHKDTKASLRKNFVDRYSLITLHLQDERVVTVNLGLTTTRTLSKIKTELDSRI